MARRFNPIDFYRKAGKTLSVAPRKRERKKVSKVPPSTAAHLFNELGDFGADYITGEREKKRATTARAEMKDVLSAYYDRGGQPAYDAVANASMDMDETSDDVDRDAGIAFNRSGGIDAVNALAPPVSLEAQDMQIALMVDADSQRRKREAAELKRSQTLTDLENNRRYTEDQKKLADQAAKDLKSSPDGKPVSRKTGKGPNGILRYIDTGEKVFDLNTPPSKTKFFKEETALRKDFEKGAKDFVKVRDAYGRIQASASDPSAAGDLALIFNYMKVLDPGSTVREGEFATAAASAGIPSRIRAQYNKVVTGERLADKQRNDFVARAGKLYSSQLGQHKLHKEYYTKVAKQYGVNPDNVVYDMAANTKTSKTATSAFDNYYASLKKGDSYIDPDGNTRKKQ